MRFPPGTSYVAKAGPVRCFCAAMNGSRAQKAAQASRAREEAVSNFSMTRRGVRVMARSTVVMIAARTTAPPIHGRRREGNIGASEMGKKEERANEREEDGRKDEEMRERAAEEREREEAKLEALSARRRGG